ncbi:MAG: excinuclease ABC subunit UvrA, partial [Pseudomonadota bacterium]
MIQEEDYIRVRGAKEHNLKSVDVDIPRNKLIVITGLSGSGKSSLAFDTIYAEGQRRYVESLSSYARQFLNIQDKPDVESISGLSPAIAIDQKTTSRNPRSTVGTVTEIYDYLRLLYARIGIPYSPATGLPIESQSVSQMVDIILKLEKGTKIYLLAPIVRGHKGEHRKEILSLQKQGFQRVRIDGIVHEITNMPEIDKNKKHNIEVVVDRIVVSDDLGNRLADSIETALKLSEGLILVEVLPAKEGKKKEDNNSPPANKIITMSSKFACPVSGFTIDEIEPRLFSFNSPFGACKVCDGLGTEMVFDPELIIPDTSLSLYEKAVAPWASSPSKYYVQTFEALAKHYKFSINTPYKELAENFKKIILHGSGDEIVKITYNDGIRSFISNKPFEGVIPNMQRRLRETESENMREEFAKFQNITRCHACNGYRLNEEAACVKVAGIQIGEVFDYTIERSAKWFAELDAKLSKKHKQIAEKVLKEIRDRLGFLVNVGLEYLTLSREAGTLSGGESQRIRLASQIGSGLYGVLYVLDEPSIGLHQCDNERLIGTLQNLKKLGNTVIVVEHDEDTMRHSDYLIDIGPGAGVHGGRIVAEGTAEQVMQVKESITGQYLSG